MPQRLLFLRQGLVAPDSLTPPWGQGRKGLYSPPVKYLTTLEVAHELKVSKQTLLNWLYAGKVPEPPRNGARVSAFGVLEARLTTFDRVILGGNCGTVIEGVMRI